MARGIPLLMRPVVRLMRRSVAAALYYSGLLRVIQRMILRRRAIVLMYHRVLTDDEQAQSASHPAIVVTRKTFERQMVELKRSFKVLTLQDFYDHVASRTPFEDSSCLITFDDGWLDNCTNALPVLREHGLPAVVFLPVNFVGSNRMFWRETLIALLLTALKTARSDPGRRSSLEGILSDVRLAHALELSGASLRAAIHDALESLKAEPSRVERVSQQLAQALGGEAAQVPVSDRFMDWSNVDLMAKQGIAFGGHGADHRLLTQISEEEASQEIETSWAVLQRTVKSDVVAFAYPNGNWSEAVAERVRRTGFRLAFTTERGVVESSDDPFTLRRLNIHEDMTSTEPLFLAHLVGLF